MLGARYKLPIRSSITHTVGTGAFQDFCPAFELAVAYYTAEGTAECPAFDSTEIER